MKGDLQSKVQDMIPDDHDHIRISPHLDFLPFLKVPREDGNRENN
jgi:hypothetical protein